VVPGWDMSGGHVSAPLTSSARTAGMSSRPDDELMAAGGGDQAASGRPQQVPVNMYEADRAVVVVAPLPGVMVDDVTVTLDDRVLTIAADMRTKAPKDYLLHEWHYGPYERTVALPEGFGGTAEATFANGQLALRVERGEGGGRRSVQVDAKP
jgi:HSP20 family protein